MKKLYILGVSLMSVGAMTAQTYETKDFEDLSLTSGGWTTQVPVDTTNWYASEQSGDKFAKISNYNGSNNVASEAWLISPSIDLSSATAPMVSFETVMKWAGPVIEVLVSTDYDGTSAPSTATWTDITAGATLDLNDQTWGSWTPSGEVDLTNYISSSVYVAFKYTGSNSDGSTWEVDNILVAETGTQGGGNGPSAPVAKTIVEIQSDVDGNGESNLKNDSVVTGGIVTAVYADANNGGYHIQSGIGAWTGIFVYDQTNVPAIGDSVTFKAVVDEYYGYTQLKGIVDFTIVNQFNSVPATIVSTANAGTEMYESVLCQVVNATCETAPNQFKEWDVNDGSGTIIAHDRFFEYPSVVIGTAYNITGVINYSYQKWSINPRDANDVSVYSSVEENTGVLTSVYPNPTANGYVTVEVSEATELVVMDLLGNVVLSQPLLNTVNTVDVANLAAGNYILKVGTSVQQLMVK
ncbi:MAG: choice-of-anchor J domain-containing protein [Flavobacteriales bacterium]|jgi:hypothetical protein|nr:choice-of-anchor J domain-containing protein [Flavobacteriales bacterium]